MYGKAHLTSIMFTLGFYDEELRKQNFSKDLIGFIDRFDDISDDLLIKHLNEVVGLSKTKCEENIRYFRKRVFFKFWELVLESIKVASDRGILVNILGFEEPLLLFPRIAFHAGDDPAQDEVAGITCGSNI